MGISLKAEIIRQGVKLGAVATAIGMNPITFSRRIQTNRFTLPETEKILSTIGLKMQIVDENSREKNDVFLQKNG